MKRRDFIKTTVPAVVLPALINGLPMKAYAENAMLNSLAGMQTATDRVLVMINLNGGNDGLNTVIPLDQYSTLSSARANILINSNQVLSLNGSTTTGLHPAMSGMRGMFNDGKLQIVQSVGYPNPSYSHFRATDIWISGSDYNQTLVTGWAGRYLDKEYPGFPVGYPNATMPDPLAIQIGNGLPLLFQGPSANMAMTVSDANIFSNWASGITDPAPATNAGKELSYIRLIAQQTQQYSNAIIAAYNNVTNQYSGYPSTGSNPLADVLKAIARLIKGGLQTRIYLVTMGGFDNHSDQVVSGATQTGTHATLLQWLSEGITAFQNDLAYLQIEDRVLGMTFSEFGRRILSNNSLGTDHGAAAPLFLFGTKVQGGILGTNPTIPTGVTVNDNLPMQYDFRSVYASILKDWFCVPQPDLDTILLQNYQTLPIINADCTSVSMEEVIKNTDLISISGYPNPFVDKTSIAYETLGGHTMIQIIDALGRVVATPVNQVLPQGQYNTVFALEGLPTGTYYCRLQNQSLQKMATLVAVRG